MDGRIETKTPPKEVSHDPEYELAERANVSNVVELLLGSIISRNVIQQGEKWVSVRSVVDSLNTNAERANFLKGLQDFIYLLPSVNRDLLIEILLHEKSFKQFAKDRGEVETKSDFYENMLQNIKTRFIEEIIKFSSKKNFMLN